MGPISLCRSANAQVTHRLIDMRVFSCAQTDSHPVQSLAPSLRQPSLASLPAGLLAPAGHFTGCEQPVHNRRFSTPTIIEANSLVLVVSKATKCSSKYCFCCNFRCHSSYVTTNTGEVSASVVLISGINNYFRDFSLLCGQTVFCNR